MTTFNLKNFSKNNTPKWAEQLGNAFLALGGFFVALAASASVLETLSPSMLSMPIIAKTIVYSKDVGVIGSMICGGVKSISKCFGIPLKDLQ